MLFSSIPFLFYFLPCVFVLYFLVPPVWWRNTGRTAGARSSF